MKRAVKIGLLLWVMSMVGLELLMPRGMLLYTPNDWSTSQATPAWKVGGIVGALIFMGSVMVCGAYRLILRLRRRSQN